MPLHLLGKKSWNVYNAASIQRVRRDEADAQARDEAADQRMQEEDAQRRIAVLRGQSVEALPPNEPDEDSRQDAWRKPRTNDTYAQRDRKRRRLRGEDDTERDMRYARQDAEAGRAATQALVRHRERDAPLQDHAGNIQLIPAPDEVAIREAEKNAEAEADKAKKRKRDEDQITMRFSNAAGYNNGMQEPWYAAGKDKPNSSPPDLLLAEVQGKDVWGNEDPRRKEREQSRIISNDPFAAMQQAQRQLKQSERDRQSWQQKQQADIERLKSEQRRNRQTRRRGDAESLAGFSLDAPARDKDDGEGRHKHRSGRHHHRHHRHQSRSRSRSHSRERDRHRSHRHRREREH